MEKQELELRIAEASRSILSYCIARTSDRHDAEDLAQDILLELTRSARSIRDDRAFYGFMWAVAGNVYKQWYRKKLRRREYELTEDIVSADDGPDAALEGNPDIFLLRRELALMSEKYRRAAILYYLENKSCSEISVLLSTSEGMVKYLLFKSRKILKDGMEMERKLGELSYNPKKLIPMYSGEGPNKFYSFMNNLIRQNIVSACYNDSLTPELISLETGIPLPYLDDEICELTDRKLLIKDGKRYSANIIIIDRECTEELCRKATGKYEEIADKLIAFVSSYIGEYRKIGFYGADFSENTLRWQLSTLMWRKIGGYSFKRVGEPPVTGWGERADVWLEEDCGELTASIFNYCTAESCEGDELLFFDYLPAKKGDHRDFYGNQRYVDILCDIAKHSGREKSGYDLEAVAEMVRKGYVSAENGKYHAALPVYTAEQYREIDREVGRYMLDELGAVVETLDLLAEKVIAERSPSRLKASVLRISGHNKFFHAVCAPAKVMLERSFLSTAYHPNEMPGAFIILK